MLNHKPSITRLANHISRCTQAHMNTVLAKYNLSSGTYPFLLGLDKNEGMNQNQISRELDIDKAMSARAIKRLIAQGYIEKQGDLQDTRSYKLYLTEQAKKILPLIREELKKWNQFICKGLNEEQREVLITLMDIVQSNAKSQKTIL